MYFINNRPKWRFINQSLTISKESPLYSFATDDTLCELVGQLQSPPVIRTWVHQSSVVLGIQDHRLPYIQDGMNLLNARGYAPIVRNSGGLAVVLDEGVLNVSIILSEQQEKMSINTGYDVMVELIRHIFPEIAEQIEAYEIVGSYCPGSYDLSVEGKKFAGISQRRIRQGVAVQIYLCIEGSGSERAALIRDFYEESLRGEETKFVYPTVNPNVMASVSEIMGVELTVQQIVDRIQTLLQNYVEVEDSTTLHEDEQEKFDFYYNRIIERNQKMLHD
jgi:octanoyl-[GcvH]:protein N-octanoyltransferase